MPDFSGLLVSVEGTLSPDILNQIADAVQTAVRTEVAGIDVMRDYQESGATGTDPSDPLRIPEPEILDLALPRPILGIIYKPPTPPHPH
ncbi:hypothetical protein [Mycobacterium sp. 050134]|uniref:hypothetical protein n=1 Tax=Mycobacterium sp. 050134 TaxID=3096111 RepID=UPI002ED7936A